ncbi:hypothetical protein Tco_0508860 [Tanacetum coccineum]
MLLLSTELPVRVGSSYYDFVSSYTANPMQYYEACNDDDTRVHFEITMTKDQMNKERQEEGELWNKLKLYYIKHRDEHGYRKNGTVPAPYRYRFSLFVLEIIKQTISNPNVAWPNQTSLPTELKILYCKTKAKRVNKGGMAKLPPKRWKMKNVAVKEICDMIT